MIATVVMAVLAVRESRWHMNQVRIIGNLGKDAEVSMTKNGKTLVKFSIAASNGKDRTTGDWLEPDWIPIVCWNVLAEKASTLCKGDRVEVDGRLKHNTYQNKEGKNVSVYYVLASNIVKMRSLESTSYDGVGTDVDTPEDIPF